MPYQPIDWTRIPLQSSSFDPSELVKKFQEGRQMKRQDEAQQLANAFQKMRNEAYPEQQRTENLEREAKAKQLEEKLKLPFGGDIPPGKPGEVYWIDVLKNHFGKDSPQAKQLDAMVEQEKEKDRILNRYRSKLTDLSDKRASSPLAKKMQEYADVEAGFYPGTDQPIGDPDKQQEMQNKIAQSLQKDATDRAVRMRVEYATNIDKTLEQLNIDDLVQYGGVKGQAQFKLDQASSALGKAPDNYKSYTKAVNLATLLRKQVRQFYGDSITPTMDERLQKLTEPATWINNPEVAKEQFDAFRNVLLKETETYKSAMGSTDIYKSKKEKKSDEEKPRRRFSAVTGKELR